MLRSHRHTFPIIAFFLLCFTLGLASFVMSGCGGTTPLPPVPEPGPIPVVSAKTPAQIAADLNNYAYTVANVLQTKNNGQTLQNEALTSSLELAGADPKTQQQAQIASALASLVGQVIIATHNAQVPAPTPVTQAAVNGVLAPTSVTAITQKVTASTP